VGREGKALLVVVAQLGFDEGKPSLMIQNGAERVRQEKTKSRRVSTTFLVKTAG